MKVTSAIISLAFLGLLLTQHSFAKESSPQIFVIVPKEAVTANEEQTQTQSIDQAMALMKQNRFKEAYSLLARLYYGNPNDIQTRFVFAMSCLELHKTDLAISLLETILNENPELQRVRLELARAYAAKGNTTKAKNEFKSVLKMNPPPQVQENINRFLALLEEEQKFRVWASAGYMYDDNVNAGPDSDYVTFFGLPFALDPAAKKQSDSAFVGNVTLDHRIPIRQNVDLLSRVGSRSVSYSSWTQFNSDEIVGSIGPLFMREQMLVKLPVVLDYAFLGSDRYSAGYGFWPEVRYALLENLSVNASVLWERKQYYSREDRTGYLWGADVYMRTLLGADAFFDVGYQHWREKTKVSFLDNDTDTVYAGLYTKLFGNTFLFAGPSVSWNAYDEREAALPHARDDMRARVNVNLSTEIFDDIELAVGYTYTDNDSNLNLYGFQRNQITVQLAKSF